MDNYYILPLSFPPRLKYSLHAAITSSIILSDLDNLEWFYSNFNTVLFYKDFSKFAGDHVFQIFPANQTRSGKNAASFLIEESLVNDKILNFSKEDLIINIKNWIKQGYYVSSVVNVSLFQNTKYYGKGFKKHGCTCVGYNEEDNTLIILDFNSNNVLSLISVPEEIFVTSYYSIKAEDAYTISLRRLKSHKPYSISTSRIKREIEAYLESEDCSELYSGFLDKEDECLWGIKSYALFLPYLKYSYENTRVIDIRPVCALLDHKRIMLKRISMLEEKGLLNKNRGLSKKYEEIVNITEKLERTVVMASYNAKNIDALYESVRKSISEIKMKEYRLLVNVCKYL